MSGLAREGGLGGRSEKHEMLVRAPKRQTREERVRGPGAHTTVKFGPEPSFFFSPGRCFLFLPVPDPAIGRQAKAYKTCRRATTGREAHMTGTGSATRREKAA